MSEESGEKTEEPTSKRLADARKDGQLPQRKNVMEAMLILAGFIGIFWSIAPMQGLLFGLFDAVFEGIAQPGSILSDQGQFIFYKARSIGIFIAAFIGGISFGVILVGLFLNGFNISMKALEPKFDKLNPVNGFKGIFSKQTFYAFLRSLFYMTIIALAWIFVVYTSISDLLYSYECGVICMGDVIIEGIIILILCVVFVQIALAVLDFKLQNIMYISQMKMTKDAVKKEYTQNEGNPLIKGARQSQVHEDQQLPSLMSLTHVIYSNSRLVAIAFDVESGMPPFVLLKAQDRAVTKTLLRLKREKRSAHFLCLPPTAKHFYEVSRINTYILHNIATQLGEVVMHSRN